MIDQLGHRCRTVGQALNDPQPVHVGEGLVKQPNLAQVIGLVDDGRNG
jgi:hypothetical protein